MGLINKILGMNRVKIVVETSKGRQVRYEGMPQGVDSTIYLADRVRKNISSETISVSASYGGEEIKVTSW